MDHHIDALVTRLLTVTGSRRGALATLLAGALLHDDPSATVAARRKRKSKSKGQGENGRTRSAPLSPHGNPPWLREATGRSAAPADGRQAAAERAGDRPIVTSYKQVAKDYRRAIERMRAPGRQAVPELLHGDVDALHARFARALKAQLSKAVLEGLPRMFATNRVHFEDAEFPFKSRLFIYDGHVAGDTIEGLLSEGLAFPFTLEATFTPTEQAPLDGQWDGVLHHIPLPFSVTFKTVNGKLRATMDIQGFDDVPMSNVSFKRRTPIGRQTDEQIVSFAPDLGIYTQLFAWNDVNLIVGFGFDHRGRIIFPILEPEWPPPPDPAAGMTPKTRFRLPFDGVWWVTSGGDRTSDNHHVATPIQRHAYDLAIWNDGGLWRGDGTRVEDHWAWGQPIVAPAAGTVALVRNDVSDVDPNGVTGGNMVVLQIGRDEFVVMAHLQEGSIEVRKGARVEAGQRLARVGNSGLGGVGPHLHIHVQNRAEFPDPRAISLPMPFYRYTANGKPVSKGVPIEGTFIRHRGGRA